MIRDGEVNPLNVFGLRELDYIPLHFKRVYFDLQAHEKDIRDWIYSRCEGRFCLTVAYNPDSEKTYTQNCAGFEDHGEAIMFALCLDKINVYDSLLV